MRNQRDNAPSNDSIEGAGALGRGQEGFVMAIVRGLFFGVAGLAMVSGLSTLAAQETVEAPRFSAFFFADELSDGQGDANRQFDVPIGLHASAIQTGGGSNRIWINGLELRAGDRIGPAKVVHIAPTTATLRVNTTDGTPKLLKLAVNQYLTLPSLPNRGMLKNLSVREGPWALDQRLRLSRTRLP